MNIYAGNAGVDGVDHRGWVVGEFMPAGDPRRTGRCEVKWGVHPAGDRRAEWRTRETASTAAFLVSGRFRVDFPDRSVTLAEPGDYVTWGVGGSHSWEALDDSVVLTVRWPHEEDLAQ